MSVRTILMTISLLLAGVATSTAQSIEQIKELIEQGQYKQAAMRLRPLADGGNAEAQYLSAILFLDGKGVQKNAQQAFKYAKMSADDADSKGILLTSWMCYEGIGTKKDTELALTYAQKLSYTLQKDAAKKLLGENSYYFEEPYPQKNEGLAFLYYELVSHVKDRNFYNDKLEALSCLSKMCYEGVGTQKDTAQAISYAKLMTRDVDNYFYSDREYKKLTEYYKERSDTMFFRVLQANAALEGDIATERTEGVKMKEDLIQCYLKGTGCEMNPSAALRIIDMQKSIRKKYLDAQSPKLDVYINAVLSSNNGESLATICDKTDNEDLLEALLKKYSNTQDAKEQQNIFQEWLHQAEEGSPSAMWMVSNFYEKGIGTEADITKSRELAQKAVDKGKNKGIWWARNEYMKCKPLQAGEVYKDKIVVYSKVGTSSYTDRKGKTVNTSRLDLRTFDLEIMEYTLKEIKDELKSKKRTFIFWYTFHKPEYTAMRIKIYADARKKIGQPMPAGQYWAVSGGNKNDEIWLLTVDADGVVTATTSMKDFSKTEKEQPHYFLVERICYPEIKPGKQIEYRL